MIRKFIQCKNTKERLNLMETTNIEDWTEGQLDTIMEIAGLKLSAGASKEDKWTLILLALSNKEVIAERAINSEIKVFQDNNDEVEVYENISDLSAYLKACKVVEVVR